MIIIYILTCLLFLSHQQVMLRDVKYILQTEGIHHYSVQMSKYEDNNQLTFNLYSIPTCEYNITNLNTSKSDSGTITGQVERKFTKSDDFFCANCVYNITIKKPDNLTSVILSYTESFPQYFVVLSDNELYSVNTTESDTLYFTYHTPSHKINPVSQVLLEFSSHASEAPKITAYISTKTFPDPKDPDTYYWTSVDLIIIKNTTDHFCNEDYCTYFITVHLDQINTFTILPNCTFKYIEIPTNDHVESADIPPMSSSYGQIYLPKSEDVNYNLEISFYYRKPNELSSQSVKVALFVSLVPDINPSTTLWYAHTDAGSDGFLRISNNDPSFCMDCNYYLRLDAAPDVYFELDTRIHTYITNDFAPIFIQSDLTIRGFLRGKDQVLNYEFKIPEDYEDDYADTLLIQVVQDVFVDENITAVVTNNHPNYPNPSCKTKLNQTLNFEDSDKAVFYIIRDMDMFCDNSSYILSITLNNDKGRIQNFNLYSYLNMEMILLTNTRRKTDYISSQTPGIYYFINGTDFDMDSDILISIDTQCTSLLYCHISTSSFRDGNSSYELGREVNKTMRLTINNGASYFILSHNFYINVGFVEQTEGLRCNYNLTMTFDSPTVLQLTPWQTDVSEYDYNSGRDGYIYASISTQYYHNIKSVSFILKYSGRGKPRNIFFKKNSIPKPKLKDYQQQVVIEDNPTKILYAKYSIFFCDDCTYYFVIDFPSDFVGKFSLLAEIDSDPYQLNYKDIHEDYIEPNSPHDYYYLQLAKNTNNPSFIISVEFGFPRLPEMFLAVTTDVDNKHPGPNNADWYDTSYGDDLIITIDSKNPKYCTGCNYYIGIGTVGSTGYTDTSYKIKTECTSGGCETCSGRFTPESNCTDCEKGYYGSYCYSCYCYNGVCDDGVKGSGTCTCYPGYTGYSCSNCADGYYGPQCKLCSIDCHGHGKCDSGNYGTGLCKCQAAFSPETNCSDCRYGYYDYDCSDVCPGAPEKTCSYNGVCNSGVSGNGRCQCNENYVGIDCNTSIHLTSCKPPCDTTHGSCDESIGACLCYDRYTGPLCNIEPSPPSPSKQGSSLSGGVIALIVILSIALIAIIAAVVYFFKKKLPTQHTRRARYSEK